jgi:hypothetical protein
MPQIVANYKFNSRQPNFARDQVETYDELLNFGGWNENDSRYRDEEVNKTDIDLGHIVYVVEKNQHYTYVKITEVDENNVPTGKTHYGWMPLSGSGAGYSGGEDDGTGDNPGGDTPPDEPVPITVFAYFKSLVFKRGVPYQAPETPSGGDFFNPVPDGWSDGIPAVTNQGEEAIWMSTRIFSSGGSSDTSFTSEWTTPSLIADTKFKDFEFSSVKDNPGFPHKANPQDDTDHGDGWSNVATEDTIWMAMRDVESGAYKQNSSWEVVKIKGEDGSQATKIKILGVKNSVDELESLEHNFLDAYIVGSKVYVWDGDSWEDSGPFRGEYDSSKDWAYLHIKYSDDKNNKKFTAFGGEVPGKWVGTYCDYNIQDSDQFDDYYWKAVGGGDGFGYEYIYRLTMDDRAPAVPDDHENPDHPDVSWESFDFVPRNWTDDPGRIDATWRWCWVCYRVAINGGWSEFKGAHGKTAAEGGVAALYAHYGADAVANSASRSFMIFTWTSLNETVNPKTPYVPVKPEDNVAKWNVIENTLEVAEGQSLEWTNDGVSGVWGVNPGNSSGNNRYLWMSTASFSEANNGEIIGHWSDPVCITGSDGRNGTDGADSVFGYHLCESMAEFNSLIAPSLEDAYDEDSFYPESGWTDHPQGIGEHIVNGEKVFYPIEAASIGIFNKETLTWSYGAPFIWARWGEDGIDGDGIEYMFYVATENVVVKSDILDPNTGDKIGENVELDNYHWLPRNEAELRNFLSGLVDDVDAAVDSFYNDHHNEWLPSGTGWTDDPSDVGPFQPYEFVSIRRFKYNETTKEGKWDFWSEPALWAKYSKDGTNGRSVFTSFAFTRTMKNLRNMTLTGGTVENPVPDESTVGDEIIRWTDTIPASTNAPVWMTSRIFDDSLTGEGTGWKSPMMLQDTPEFQVEYTAKEEWNQAALPNLNNYIDWNNFPEEGIDEPRWRNDARTATNATWGDIYDEGSDIIDPCWMITARRGPGGVWSNWAIHRIKGEKGQPGTSISVKGSFTSYRDLGDPTGDPAGQVDHSSVSMGDCYIINGVLWVYDGNNTKTSPYSTEFIVDPSGDGQLGDRYAGFSCQGQFKGDPGDTSWIHVRFANKSELTGTSLQELIDSGKACNFGGVYIQFTGSDYSGIVPGKYAGIAITSDRNVAPSSINQYMWSEWRGDDIYGTEQIFTLSGTIPPTPTRPTEGPDAVSEAEWNTFDYVPKDWSDTPSAPTPDAHCWVSTRRLSDPEDKNWKTPVIYTRYAQDGHNGIDGAVNEFIYHLGSKNNPPEYVKSKARKYENGVAVDTKTSGVTAEWWSSDDSRDYCPADNENGYWTDNPQGVQEVEDQQVEYYAYRTREYDPIASDDEHNVYVWSDWSPIKIWSSWGQKGRDGDGVEYIFTLTKIYKTPSNPTPYKTVDGGESVIDTEAKDANDNSWSDYDYAPTIPAADYDPEDSTFTEHVWIDDPQEPDSTWRYQWVSMRRSHSNADANAEWSEFSQPVLWNKYTEDGKDGRTEEFIYFLSTYGSDDRPIVPTIDDTRAFNDETGDEKSGLTLEGWQELVDYAPALGNKEDFGDWLDYLEENETVYWNDNPQSISPERPVEYRSSRFKIDGVWSPWEAPIVWSSWGQKGHDGDGVEYIFARTANKDIVPVLTNETGAFNDNNDKSWTDDDFVPRTSIPGTDPLQYLDWTDDPQGATKELRVEWVSIRKTFNGEWAASGDRKCWSEPKIWKEYDESNLEEKIYHYGGKTTDPALNQFWDFRGNAFDPHTDGFIPADINSDDPGVPPSPVYSGEEEYDPNGWTPYKKGINPDNKYEYEAVRKKNPSTGLWGDFVGPTLYAAWGEDGDSVEFAFWMVSQDDHEWIQANKGETGISPNSESYIINEHHYDPADSEFLPYLELYEEPNQVRLRAQDDPSDVTASTPYIYASKREKRRGEWQAFGPVFLYTQLVLAPDYACTLNLSEDMQGVAVSDEGNNFKSVGKNVGFSNEELNLKLGPEALIVNEVKIASITRTYENGALKPIVGTPVTVWTNASGQVLGSIEIAAYDTENNIISSTINVSVSSSGDYFRWFSWSSADHLVFGKKPDGTPDDLTFVIYAYGGTAVNSSTSFGTATFTIHPIEGNEFYELEPNINVFKKLKVTPFNRSSIEFMIEKKIQSENSYTYAYCNEEEWNASYQEDRDNIWIQYRGDEAENWTIARASIPSNTHRIDATTSNYRYSVVPGEFADSGDSYLKFNVVLFDHDGPDSSIREYFPELVNGITIQIYVGNVLHDEEFIPVVYDGKKGPAGDYYQEERIYHLSDTPNFSTLPDEDEHGTEPTGSPENDAQVWLSSIVSPDATYRYLFACSRMNKYYGEQDEELGIHYGDIHVRGEWEEPFVYISRSIDGTIGYGSPGGEGRGVQSFSEYYLCNNSETLSSNQLATWAASDPTQPINNDPSSAWSLGSIPYRGDATYLWNFEIITYTTGEPTKTEPGIIGGYGRDGESTRLFAEYYYWSDKNSGSDAYPEVSTSYINDESNISGSWWSSGYQENLASQTSDTRRYLWNFEETLRIHDFGDGVGAFGSCGNNQGSFNLDSSKTVSGVKTYYQWTNSSESSSIQEANWTEYNTYNFTLPTTNVGSNYLWTYAALEYSDSTVSKTTAKCLTENGEVIIEEALAPLELRVGYLDTVWFLSSEVGEIPESGGTWEYKKYSNPEDLVAKINSEKPDLIMVMILGMNAIVERTAPVCISQSGTNGRSITAIHEYYRWTPTNEAPDKDPMNLWMEGGVPDAGENGKYLWNFERIDYSSYPDQTETDVELVGNISENGIGISGFAEYYYWGTDDIDETPEKTSRDNTLNSWCDTFHQVELARQASDTRKYLWNFEEITYDNNETSSTNPVIVGQNGTNGRGVSEIFEYYRWTSNDSAPESPTLQQIASNTLGDWALNNVPNAGENDKYLWNFEYFTYTVGEPTKTPVALVGTIGDDGLSVSGFTEYYYWSTSNEDDPTSYPAKTSIGNALDKWTNSQTTLASQQANINRKYLWNWEVITLSDESTKDTWPPVVVAVNGEVGNGILRVDEYYLWTQNRSLSDDEQDAKTSGTDGAPDETIWAKNRIPDPIDNKPYLWNFEILTYTNGDKVPTSAAIISSLGKGIKSVVEKYQWSDQDGSAGHQLTSDSTGWTEDLTALQQQASETNKYLWNYEIVTYSDDSSVPTTPIIISVRGTKGDDGKYSQFVYFRSKSDLSGLSYSQVTSNGSPVLYTFTGSGEKVPVFKYGSYYISPKNSDVTESVGSTYTNRPASSPFYASSSDVSYITDDPQGINDTWRYEYESLGTFDPNATSAVWTFSKPALHNYKASDGTSEYHLYKAGTETAPAPPSGTWSSYSGSINDLTNNSWRIDRQEAIDDVLEDSTGTSTIVWRITTLVPVTEINSPSLTEPRSWSEPSMDYEMPKKGESITGPAVRGPVEWTNATGRNWLSGKGESSFAESDKWIDVVIYNSHYYVCLSSHASGSSSSIVPNPNQDTAYWHKADAEYGFIATKVLVANAGAIDVLKSGSLLLKDDSDNVVGGAKGTNLETGTIFWAGGTYSNGTINGAPFVVNKAGAMTSSSGTIGGWTIGTDSLSATGSGSNYTPSIMLTYTDTQNKQSITTLHNDGLYMSSNIYDESYASILPHEINYSEVRTLNGSPARLSTTISGYGFSFLAQQPLQTGHNPNIYSSASFTTYGCNLDLSGPGGSFNVYLGDSSNSYVSINASSIHLYGNIDADDITAESISSESISSESISADSLSIGGKAPVVSFGSIQFKIALVVSSFSDAQSILSNSGSTWAINGTDTGISTSTYPSLSFTSMTGGGNAVVFNGTSGSVYTGIVLSDGLVRRGDTIYIEI